MLVMSRRTLAVVLGSLASVSVIAGCAPIGDPVLPPIGIREDSGIVSVIVPTCTKSNPLKSAAIARESAASAPAASWSATGFTGDQSHGIELSPRDWSTVNGSYAGLMSFTVMVYGDRHNYGTVVDSQADLNKLQSLPSGSFFVEGKTMTAADYLASVSKDFPC